MRLNTSHKFIKVEGEDRIDVTTDKTTIKPEMDHTVEIGIHLIEAEEILTDILDQIIEVDQGITIDGTDTGKVIGVIVPDKITEETTIQITKDKIIENKGIEVQVGIIIEITIETIPREKFEQSRDTSRDRSRERQLQPQSRTESEGRRDSDRSRTESRFRSRSIVSTNRDRIRCYKCREYNHFARECPNVITDEDSDHSDLDQVTLQMLTQDNLVDSDYHAPVECLNM